MASITSLESRSDRNINANYLEIIKNIENIKSETEKDELYRNIMHSLKDSIKSKCLQYESVGARLKVKGIDVKVKVENKEEIRNREERFKDKLGKELSEEIGLLKKLEEYGVSFVKNLEENEESFFKKLKEIKIQRTIILYQDIDELETDFILKLFSILFKYFPSNFNPKKGILQAFLENRCSTERLEKIHQLSDNHSEIHKTEIELESEFKFLSKIDEIGEKIVQKQNKIMGIWKPQNITKKSFIERLRKLTCIDHDVISDTISQINNFKGEIEFKRKGLIVLNNNLEIFITNQNNCYLISKLSLLGQGASKSVYAGIDLSKNQLVAALYAPSQSFKEEEDLIRLENELKDEERRGIGNITDCLRSTPDDPENDPVQIIFISDRYNPNISNIEDKVQFCKEMIEIMYTLVKKNILPSDIKPLNLCQQNEHPIFIDLPGKGKTLLYSAPEILSNHKLEKKAEENDFQEIVNEKSLIWSFGMTLYQIYCGSNLIKDIYSKDDFIKEEDTSEEHARVKKLTENCIKRLTNEDIDREINNQIKRHEDNETHCLFLKMIRSMLEINTENRATFFEIITKSKIMRDTKSFAKISLEEEVARDLEAHEEKNPLNRTPIMRTRPVNDICPTTY